VKKPAPFLAARGQTVDDLGFSWTCCCEVHLLKVCDRGSADFASCIYGLLCILGQLREHSLPIGSRASEPGRLMPGLAQPGSMSADWLNLTIELISKEATPADSAKARAAVVYPLRA
jgi:hypothetical protein